MNRPPSNADDPRVVLRDFATGRWLDYGRPRRIVQAARIEDVAAAVRTVQDEVERKSLHAAGWLSYEAAPAFAPALRTRAPDRFPLLWFGLFDPPAASDALPDPAPPPQAPLHWQPSIDAADYRRAFEEIRTRLRDGDSYQVNYTLRMRARVEEDPWQLFLRLADAQASTCGAFIDAGDWIVCSASPESFFRLDGERIESRPMKGTAARGRWYAEDRRRARALRESVKQRAENLMIVDMVRNDLGRIARTGSVAVPTLFATEPYPTVWQMVSTVAASTDAPLDEILAALFPAASITGAPRRRTMEIIADLEDSPRRIYTGAIGCLAPGRRVQFNVAIRTVLIEAATRQAEFGVGGGVVWDSRWEREWEECRTKARILNLARPRFDLLETLLWQPGSGFALLGRHLRRLADSARYFGYPCDTRAIRRALRRAVGELPQEPHRVRLTLARDGAVHVSSTSLAGVPAGFADLTLARAPIDAADPFLYHKTTHRRVYEDALRACPGFADVILYNADGEVTESTIANVVVEIDGRLCTPPLRCGLLGGTQRAALLAAGRIRERVIRVDELLAAPRILLANSVRGLHPVRLIMPPGPTGGSDGPVAAPTRGAQ
ncbi:MAG: aminodeoxychorismate synthase component I [Gammaproteobacteria bacterium]